MELLINIILTSLATCGLFIACDPNNIGGSLNRLLEKLPDLIYAPLLGCITCMGSVYGTLGWYLLGGGLIELPFYILCTAFLNTVFYLIYDRLLEEKITGWYKVFKGLLNGVLKWVGFAK